MKHTSHQHWFEGTSEKTGDPVRITFFKHYHMERWGWEIKFKHNAVSGSSIDLGTGKDPILKDAIALFEKYKNREQYTDKPLTAG